MKPNMKNPGCSIHTSSCCYNGSEYWWTALLCMENCSRQYNSRSWLHLHIVVVAVSFW